MKKTLLLLAALAAPFAVQAQTAVDLELILVVDVSGSVDTTDYNLQMDGYGAAFRSAAVQSGIAGGTLGQIAVNVVFFASSAAEWTNGWQLIDSNAAADAFAGLLETVARPGSGLVGSGTNIDAGLFAAAPLFGSNTYDAPFQVADVSGDGLGANGQGRNAALAAGVDTINGIVIADLPFASIAQLTQHFEDNVISPNGQVFSADSFNDFAPAVEAKLVEEITDPGNTGGPVVPEASEYGMMGAAALILLGLVRRLRK